MAVGAVPLQLHVVRAGLAHAQDLGRPGLGGVGVPPRGAADHDAARTANILVGNRESAPLIEVTGSDVELRFSAAALVAVTGLARVRFGDHQQPIWETLVVPAGTLLRVGVVPGGRHAYVAINGDLLAAPTLGSVAADPVIAPPKPFTSGDVVTVRSRFDGLPRHRFGPVFRLGSAPPVRTGPVAVTPGPDQDLLADPSLLSSATFTVATDSDQTGLRLIGPTVHLTTDRRILSRGVPVGAVEVTPSGQVLVLLRGRLVTAGYPVVAVATTEAIDRLGQAAPGASLRFEPTDVTTATQRLRRRAAERETLAHRVRGAFVASGIGDCLPR